MRKYNIENVKNSLKLAGLKKNDSIFLTTNLANLGMPITNNRNYINTACEWILNSLRSIIGTNGNIFVPTYSYSFTNKKKFCQKKTKAEIGYFPNFFLKQNKIVRSLDPMFSVAGLGPKSKELLSKLPNSSFGKDCIFERFLRINRMKSCTIGLGYNWIPFLHYLDWLNQVPFRFEKKLTGFAKINNRYKKINWIFYARYLREESVSDGYKIGNKAKRMGIFKTAKLGGSIIHLSSYKKLFYFSKKISKKNKWISAKGPEF